jgi:cytidylate kinase
MDLIIAIDGYSSCGKSSLARDIARELGYAYIDTGAMYRAVTWYALNRGVIAGTVIDEERLKIEMSMITITFRFSAATFTNDTLLNGKNVEEEIRSPLVASLVSHVSALPFVRHRMVALQQEMGKDKRVVMDGRDIGTVVFPDAEVKIFMTADPEVRARRRLAELLGKEIPTSFEEVRENLKQRDYLDENRETAPLRKAAGAFVIDNTRLSRQEQLKVAMDYIKKKMNES